MANGTVDYKLGTIDTKLDDLKKTIEDMKISNEKTIDKISDAVKNNREDIDSLLSWRTTIVTMAGFIGASLMFIIVFIKDLVIKSLFSHN